MLQAQQFCHISRTINPDQIEYALLLHWGVRCSFPLTLAEPVGTQKHAHRKHISRAANMSVNSPPKVSLAEQEHTGLSSLCELPQMNLWMRTKCRKEECKMRRFSSLYIVELWFRFPDTSFICVTFVPSGCLYHYNHLMFDLFIIISPWNLLEMNTSVNSSKAPLLGDWSLIPWSRFILCSHSFAHQS